MAYQEIAKRQQVPHTSAETYEDNINWLHELLLDEDRIEMIQKMEQLPNVIAMSTPRYKNYPNKDCGGGKIHVSYVMISDMLGWKNSMDVSS